MYPHFGGVGLLESPALNASFGDRAWLEVLRAHNEVVTSVTLEQGGTVVKGIGDGFMLAFSSSRTAVTASQAIQDQIAETFNDPGSPIRVRIGIYLSSTDNGRWPILPVPRVGAPPPRDGVHWDLLAHGAVLEVNPSIP